MKILNKLEHNKLKGQDEDTENGEDNLNTFNTRFKKIQLVFQNGQTLELPVENINLEIFEPETDPDSIGNCIYIDENLKTIQAHELNLEINDLNSLINNSNLVNILVDNNSSLKKEATKAQKLINNGQKQKLAYCFLKYHRISSIELTSLNDHQTTINLPDEINYNQIVQLNNSIIIKIRKNDPESSMIVMIGPFLILAAGGLIAVLLPYLLPNLLH